MRALACPASGRRPHAGGPEWASGSGREDDLWRGMGRIGYLPFFMQIALTNIGQSGRIRGYVCLKGRGVYCVFVMSRIDASRQGAFSDGVYAAKCVAAARCCRGVGVVFERFRRWLVAMVSLPASPSSVRQILTCVLGFCVTIHSRNVRHDEISRRPQASCYGD